MFKSLTKLTKSKNFTYIILGVLVLGVVAGVAMYSNGKSVMHIENFEEEEEGGAGFENEEEEGGAGFENKEGEEGFRTFSPQDVNAPGTLGVSAPGCASKAVVDPSELLPKDTNSEWASLNPHGSNPLNVNLLEANKHIGINTVGSSLRNANLQLRSEPANPRVNVGPWMNSTIEPDTYRRPLEMGNAPNM